MKKSQLAGLLVATALVAALLASQPWKTAPQMVKAGVTTCPAPMAGTVDQTNQLQNLLTTQPDNSVLTLPYCSVWTLGSVGFGTLTSGLADSSSVTQLMVTTSGTADIPDKSQITIENGGEMDQNQQVFTTNTDTPPGSTTVNVRMATANAHYPIGTQGAAVPTINANGIDGLTINGNGATFLQVDCGQLLGTVPSSAMVFLSQDTNVSINNLALIGPNDNTYPDSGCSQGNLYEASASFFLEANTNTLITNVSVNGVQGDFIDFQNPNDCGSCPNAVNVATTVSNSRFHNAGYHDITIEAVGPNATYPKGGANIVGNTFSGSGDDAIDFEVDSGGTAFSGTGCALPESKCPVFSAEDNVLIATNTFIGWHVDWLASLQDSGQKIQEYNNTLSGNTLNSTTCVNFGSLPCSLMQVAGNDPTTTSPLNLMNGFNLFHNTATAGLISVNGGSCAGSFTGNLSEVTNVVNADIENNTFLADYGVGEPDCGNPYLAAMQAVGTYYMTLKNNNFTGAEGILHASSGNVGITNCGNVYGAAGTTTLPPGSNPPCP